MEPVAGDSSGGGVQSVERALDLLERLGRSGGELGLSQLAADSGLPPPTIHRLLKSLVAYGFVRQSPSRKYALGPKLIPLGEMANASLASAALPLLESLVDKTGETANLAMLEGDRVVYLAQVPSRHSMRMFTEVGRRVMPHCTGVGKALLSMLSENDVRALLQRTGMPAQTDQTITDIDAMLVELDTIRRQGFAIDDGEQEVGVRCVAVAVPGGSTMAAVSISGPAARITTEAALQVAPAVQAAAAALADNTA